MESINTHDLMALEQRARACFEGVEGCHDWDHTQRVWTLAQRIAIIEGGDFAILRAAALLHDIGRKDEHLSSGAQCHAEIGAIHAETWMRELGIESSIRDRITHCIRAHRYRGKVEPESLEARILFDADKLDSIGAVGIGRAFQFAGEVGARLHDPDLIPEQTTSYSLEDTAYREYLVKLCHVRERMKTETGRTLAKERHDFMDVFFQRLNQEVKGEI